MTIIQKLSTICAIGGIFSISASALEIASGVASGVARTNATIACTVVSTNGTTNVVSAVVYYGVADHSTNPASWANSATSIVSATGLHTNFIFRLIPATWYYYRHSLREGTNTYWTAASSNFVTIAGVPTSIPAMEHHAVMVDINGVVVAPINFLHTNLFDSAFGRIGGVADDNVDLSNRLARIEAVNSNANARLRIDDWQSWLGSNAYLNVELDPIWSGVSNTVTVGAEAGATASQPGHTQPWTSVINQPAKYPAATNADYATISGDGSNSVAWIQRNSNALMSLTNTSYVAITGAVMQGSLIGDGADESNPNQFITFGQSRRLAGTIKTYYLRALVSPLTNTFNRMTIAVPTNTATVTVTNPAVGSYIAVGWITDTNEIAQVNSGSATFRIRARTSANTIKYKGELYIRDADGTMSEWSDNGNEVTVTTSDVDTFGAIAIVAATNVPSPSAVALRLKVLENLSNRNLLITVGLTPLSSVSFPAVTFAEIAGSSLGTVMSVGNRASTHLDMGGYSITNVGTNGITFTDGTSLRTTKILAYDKLTAGDTNLNFAIGPQAGLGFTNWTPTYIAWYGVSNASTTYVANVFLGSDAGTNASGIGSLYAGKRAGASSFGRDNNYFGVEAGMSARGDFNTYLGSRAGYRSRTESSFFAGHGAGDSAVGKRNSYIGYDAGDFAVGKLNHYDGTWAGFGSKGNYNSYFGLLAGAWSTGSNNTYVGRFAGNAARGTNNTYVGEGAGDGTVANDTVFIGMTNKSVLISGSTRIDNLWVGGNQILQDGTIGMEAFSLASVNELRIAALWKQSMGTTWNLPGGFWLDCTNMLEFNSTFSTNYSVSSAGVSWSGTNLARVQSEILSFDGTNGSTTFLNVAGSVFTATTGSGSPYITNTPAVFAQAGFFQGVDQMRLNSTITNAFLFAGDFTLSMWIWCKSWHQGVWNTGIVSTEPTTGGFSSKHYSFHIHDAGQLGWYDGAGNNIFGASVTTGKWHHAAITRSGTSLKLWLDGTNTGSGTASTTYGATNITIGTRSGGGEPFDGFIDDIAVANTALYTSTFVPPTFAAASVTNISTNVVLRSATTNWTTEMYTQSHGRVVMYVDSIPTTTRINTDLTARVSWDNGANWTPTPFLIDTPSASGSRMLYSIPTNWSVPGTQGVLEVNIGITNGWTGTISGMGVFSRE